MGEGHVKIPITARHLKRSICLTKIGIGSLTHFRQLITNLELHLPAETFHVLLDPRVDRTMPWIGRGHITT